MGALGVDVVLVVILDVEPIDVVPCFLGDGAVSTVRVGRLVSGEPRSDGSVGDEVLAGREVGAEGLSESDEPLFSFARTVVDSFEVFVINIDAVKIVLLDETSDFAREAGRINAISGRLFSRPKDGHHQRNAITMQILDNALSLALRKTDKVLNLIRRSGSEVKSENEDVEAVKFRGRRDDGATTEFHVGVSDPSRGIGEERAG